MSIKNKKLIRDAMGSPIPQIYNEEQGIFVPMTNGTGDATSVDFTKIKLIRDALGSVIPQYFDVTQNKFIPNTSNGGGGGGEQGPPGEDGKSAYQLAIDNGFIGTEIEWLASLKGAVEIPSKEYTDYANTFPMGVSIMRVSESHFAAWRQGISASSNSIIIVITTRLEGMSIQEIYTHGYTAATQTVGTLQLYKVRSSRAQNGNNVWNGFTNIYPPPSYTYYNPNGTYQFDSEMTMRQPSKVAYEFKEFLFGTVSNVFGAFSPSSTWSNISGNPETLTPPHTLAFKGLAYFECTFHLAMSDTYSSGYNVTVRFAIYDNMTDANANDFDKAKIYDVMQFYNGIDMPQFMQYYMPPIYGGNNKILKVYVATPLTFEHDKAMWHGYTLHVKLIGNNNTL